MRNILIVVLLILVAGCGNGFEDYSLNKASFNAESLTMVEQSTAIQLPVGSKGINMFYQRSQSVDPSFVAKIKIPQSSQETFE